MIHNKRSIVQMTSIALALFGLLLTACQPKKPTQSLSNMMTMLVGTYTADSTQGINIYQFDQENGTHKFVRTVPVSNPSYLTFSADKKQVYAVSENDSADAMIHAYSYDSITSSLTHLNNVPTHGAYPCYIQTDGHMVTTANYGGGSLTTVALNEDGSLKPNPVLTAFDGYKGASKAHMHCVRFSPDSTTLYASDLGNSRLYSFNHSTYPTPQEHYLQLPPKTGPRHFVFSPNNPFFYVLTELSGQVFVYKYTDNQFTQQQVVQNDSVGGHQSGDIRISPDGKFLYASNRHKADGIAIYQIAQDGLLTKVDYQATGIHPRNFKITPNGKFLLVACRDSDCIEVYKRDLKTGLLTNTHQDISLYHPVCIQFDK